jgi:hypothetical protein
MKVGNYSERPVSSVVEAFLGNICGFLLFVTPVLRQNLVTIDNVDFLRPSATLYRYEGITILAVLLFQSNTQRVMRFGS